MKILFLSLLCTLSTAVFAADARIAGFKVKSLRVSSNTGNTYVMPNSPVQQKNSSCSSTDFYAIHKDDSSYQQIYSALLAAAASDKTVFLWVSIDSGDCLNSRQRITITEVNF